MKERVNTLETKVVSIENEMSLHRKFKHDTNGHLQNHVGKMSLIENQHLNTVQAIEKLTIVVESALVKIGGIINLKFMLVGGAAVGTVMISGAVFMLKMYMEYHK